MKKKVLAYLLGFTLLAALFILFPGCPNFMQGNDVKNVISVEVAEANAPEISVRIQPLSSEMGTTTPNGVITEKVGIPFTVSTAANSEYAFIGWDSPAESVSFEDIEAAETTVVASQAQDEEILIVSNFNARPRVLTHEPFSQDGVLRNQPIRILFSEAVDPATINYENITVVAKPRTSTDEPVSIVDLLEAPQVTGSNVLLELKSGQEFDAQNYIIVSLAKVIKDLDGHEMSSEFSWAFITGSSSDLSNPAINKVTIELDVNGDGTVQNPEEIFDETSTGIFSRSDTMKVIVDASDDVSVETLYIYEAGLTDGNGTLFGSADNRDLWQEDYYGKNFEYSFTFDSNGYDGLKRLRFVALDGPQKTSDPVDILISLDTTSPALSGFAIKGGDEYATSTSNVPIDITVADPGNPGTDETVGSGMAYYYVDNDETPPADQGSWVASTTPPAEIDLSSFGEGLITVFFHVQDGVGNKSYTSDSITIDNDPPTIGSISLNGGAATGQYTGSSSVNYSFSAGDVGASGVEAYQVKAGTTDKDPDAGSWLPWSANPVTGAVTLEGEGENTVYIWVRDNAGNVTENTSAAIILDTSDPYAENVSLNGGAATGQATNSTTLNYGFDAADSGPSGVDEYQVKAGITPQTPGAGWSNWTSNPVSGSVSLTEGEGTYSVYFWVKDNADNTNEGSADLGSITLDQTDPTITEFNFNGLENPPYYNDYQNVPVNAAANDNGTVSTGLAGYAFTGDPAPPAAPGDWTSYSGDPSVIAELPSSGPGTQQVYFHVKDNAGNTATSGPVPITLDFSEPNAENITLDGGAATGQATNTPSVNYQFDATDSGLSGVYQYQIRASKSAQSPGASWTDWTANPVSGSVGLTEGEGDYTIYFWVKDKAGNTNEGSADLGSITLDQTDPTITGFSFAGLGDPAYYNDDENVPVSTGAHDNGGGESGLAGYAFTGDPAPPTLPGDWTTPYGSDPTVIVQLPAAGEGTQQIYFHVQDAAGNTDTWGPEEITLDLTPPEITDFAYDGLGDPAYYNDYQNVPVTTAAGDVGTVMSGLAGYAFTDSGTPPSLPGDWTTPYGSNPTTIAELPSSGAGAQDVYFHVKDKAGNTDSWGPEEITLDYTDPAAENVSLDGGAATGQATGSTGVNYEFDATDTGLSGVAQYQVRASKSAQSPGATWTDWASNPVSGSVSLSEGEGDYTVFFWVKDKAGNTNEGSADLGSITLDQSDPTESFVSVTENASDVTLNITITETVSEADTLTYWEGSGARPDPPDSTGPFDAAITPPASGTGVSKSIVLAEIYQETFTYVVVDAADNESTERTVTYDSGGGGSYSGSLAGGTGSGGSRRLLPSSDDKTASAGYYGSNGYTGYQSIISLDGLDETETRTGVEAEPLPLPGEMPKNLRARGLSGRDNSSYGTEGSSKKAASASGSALEQPDFSAFIVTGDPEKTAGNKAAPVDVTSSSGDAIVSTAASSSAGLSVSETGRSGGSGRGGGRAEADKPLNPETEKPQTEPWRIPAEALNRIGSSTGISALSPSGGPGGGPEDVPGASQTASAAVPGASPAFGSGKVPREGGPGEEREGPGEKGPQKSPPQAPPKPDLWIADDQRAESKSRRFDIEGDLGGAVI